METWKVLISNPAYILTFLEGFLMLFVPIIGGGNALDGGGTIDLKAWPSPQTFLAAWMGGLYGGIRSLRNLMTTPPRIDGEDRRAPAPPVAAPKPGGG